MPPRQLLGMGQGAIARTIVYKDHFKVAQCLCRQVVKERGQMVIAVVVRDNNTCCVSLYRRHNAKFTSILSAAESHA